MTPEEFAELDDRIFRYKNLKWKKEQLERIEKELDEGLLKIDHKIGKQNSYVDIQQRTNDGTNWTTDSDFYDRLRDNALENFRSFINAEIAMTDAQMRNV